MGVYFSSMSRELQVMLSKLGTSASIFSFGMGNNECNTLDERNQDVQGPYYVYDRSS